MQVKTVPSSVSSFLKAHGGDSPAEYRSDHLGEVVRVFRDSAPAKDSDPLSQENLIWLTALLDCISVTDEQLYEHYRALVDLFRAGVFRAPREKMLACPSWNALREKAVLLGLLSDDLYGKTLPRPHPGVPEGYHRMMEGKKK